MRKLKFGGTNLKPGQKTWFTAAITYEPDPDDNGELIQVGGQNVIVNYGETVVAEDMGVNESTGQSWAEYHVATGRASWVEEPKPPKAKPKEEPQEQ